MCLSAQASFTVAAALGISGCMSLAYAKKEHRLMALTPFFFAIQQIAEGFVWLGMHQQIPLLLMSIAAYIFCFFATMFWPLWLSYALDSFETNPHKKTLFKKLQKAVLFYAAGLFFILSYYGVHPEILDGHLAYFSNNPLSIAATIIYHILMFSSFFLSSFRIIHYTGGLILLLSILSLTKFYNSFASMWCFFAAVTSILTFWLLQQLKKE